MSKMVFTTLITALVSSPLFAASDTTATGKIQYVQGHYTPSCRMIKHKENGTGVERTFRVADVATHDDVNAVALAALVSNRDVTITFDSTQTTGCGSEPKILYITIF